MIISVMLYSLYSVSSGALSDAETETYHFCFSKWFGGPLYVRRSFGWIGDLPYFILFTYRLYGFVRFLQANGLLFQWDAHWCMHVVFYSL